jgi:hypothetical protein
MQSAGMSLRIENAGKITATASAINTAESTAGLKAAAKGIENALNQALAWTCQMLRVTEVTCNVYDEFGEDPPVGDLATLTQLRTLGELTRPTLWRELVRRHVLDNDFDPEEEQIELDKEEAINQAKFGTGFPPSAAGTGGQPSPNATGNSQIPTEPTKP